MSAVELLPPGEATPDNPRWHDLRRGGVTASEIGVILGLSTWDSPWALWHRKRGLISDEDAGESAGWGRRLEPVIADAAADRLDPHETLAFVPAGLYAHPQRRWQMATPDRLVHQECDCCAGGHCSCGIYGNCPECLNTGLDGPPEALLELKHPYSWDGWGDDGTDDIPAGYMAQCLWQLDVMGLDECWLAAYSRHQLRTYRIRRDAEGADVDLAMMRQSAHEFLTADDPPPLDAHPATLRAVKALHPDIEDREQGITLRTRRDYLAACRELRAAQERKRAAEAALTLEMGAARYGVSAEGDRIATRSIYERRSLNTAGLRRDHPDPAIDPGEA